MCEKKLSPEQTGQSSDKVSPSLASDPQVWAQFQTLIVALSGLVGACPDVVVAKSDDKGNWLMSPRQLADCLLPLGKVAQWHADRVSLQARLVGLTAEQQSNALWHFPSCPVPFGELVQLLKYVVPDSLDGSRVGQSLRTPVMSAMANYLGSIATYSVLAILSHCRLDSNLQAPMPSHEQVWQALFQVIEQFNTNVN